jgi:glycosyltransferase involved in cell wall biosynthesis
MKIGVFVAVVAGQKGFESNVSGHIQVPLRGIEELRAEGHDVHLITTEFSEERSLPFCLEDDVKVHTVTDARNRGGVLERTGAPGTGVSVKKLLRQVSEIKKICKEQNFDVLHLYGYNRTAHLAGGLKLLGLKTPVVVTIFGTHFPERFSGVTKLLWKRIDRVVTATSYVKNNLEQEGIPTTQIKHGVIRTIAEEYEGDPITQRNRVLFWRDLTFDNGADVVIAAYEKLAPTYPDIHFDFAVRQHWEPIEGIEEIADKYDNIHMYHFPYEEGITLPKLLLESICVVMPIRQMSIDPQLVIAESLATGVSLITTDQRSNPEFVLEGVTGHLVPLGDIDATVAALDKMLSNVEATIKMGEKAKEDIASRWNWDNYVTELVEVYKSVTGS